MTGPDLTLAAADLLGRLCAAVLDDRDALAALSLLTPQMRLELAEGAVADECDRVDYSGHESRVAPPLRASEQDDDAAALASFDTSHRAWTLFAEDVLLTLRSGAESLRRALAGAEGVVLRMREQDAVPTSSGPMHLVMGGEEDPDAPVHVDVGIARTSSSLHVASLDAWRPTLPGTATIVRADQLRVRRPWWRRLLRP